MRNQIISFLFIACLFISACSNDDDRDVRKVTDYKEYTLTVASKKLPGVVTSCGNSTLTDVYAVKNESQSEWQPLGNITKFDYEPGYEYQIRISATSYLDRNMGEPAWTEYKLLEVLSKGSRKAPYRSSGSAAMGSYPTARRTRQVRGDFQRTRRNRGERRVQIHRRESGRHLYFRPAHNLPRPADNESAGHRAGRTGR